MKKLSGFGVRSFRILSSEYLANLRTYTSAFVVLTRVKYINMTSSIAKKVPVKM